MTTLSHPKRLNVIEQIRPGMVGSVGDTLVVNRRAQSMPESPVVYDPEFSKMQSANGSMLTRQPKITDSAWGSGRSEKVAYGMIQQDIRAPDKLHEPTVVDVPRFDWNNQVATTYEAKRRGNKFLPLPGPYQLMPGETSRGGQVVRVTDVEGELKMADQIPQQPMFGKGMGDQRGAMPVTNGLVDKRPNANPVNQTAHFTVMAPQSGLGTSSRYSIS